ncbi:unnamed protein product [Schistosoma guineensis]|nr:unnamed protein product [Schistosoma guineensis]
MEKERIKSVIEFFSTPLDEEKLIDGESKPDELYTLCDDPMQVPIKLIDEQLRFVNLATVQDLFVDNSGFLVVGAIGLQGSGKSSVLNILANCISDGCGVFDGPFNIQTLKDVVTNSPCTAGINLYITQDRVILLDAQPILSFALTNYHTHLVATGLSFLTGPGNWNMDIWAGMASMQIVAFLINVCHVVLVVSDNLTTASTQLHRLIDRAIGLKPTVFTPNATPIHALRGRQHSDIHNKSSDNNKNCTDIKKLTTSVQGLQISNVNKTNPSVINKDNKSLEVEDVDILSLSEHQQFIGNYSTSNNILGQYLHSTEAESKDVTNAINRLVRLSEPSSVSSDKGLASSQKPSNISAETLTSVEVDNESKPNPTHCLTSLNTIQEKSKPFSGEKPDGFIPLDNSNNNSNNCVKTFGLSESEIVSQCCNVLHNVEDELNYVLKHTNLSAGVDHHKKIVEERSGILPVEGQLPDNDLLHIPGNNGEKLNASLVQMYHDVQTTRCNFFNVQKRLDQPRLFLIPEVDDKGHSPLGCPTYLTAARILQEAVFSTPRQHIMPNFTEKKWITYVHKMWDAVIHSPLFLDYHSVRMNHI